MSPNYFVLSCKIEMQYFPELSCPVPSCSRKQERPYLPGSCLNRPLSPQSMPNMKLCTSLVAMALHECLNQMVKLQRKAKWACSLIGLYSSGDISFKIMSYGLNYSNTGFHRIQKLSHVHPVVASALALLRNHSTRPFGMLNSIEFCAS